VGSGEGLGRPDLSVGDGVYKSIDAGKTWTHLGLRDGQQIPNIAVDPGNANRLFVAVAGHPYGPNEERGIFRSTDGGQSFEKVLFKDVNTGGNDVDIDPSNPNIVYATLWEERQGPWENAQWRGTGGGIYKSTDGGSTWKQLTTGLPQNGALTQADLTALNELSQRLRRTGADPMAGEYQRMVSLVNQLELAALRSQQAKNGDQGARTADSVDDSRRYRDNVAEYYRRLGVPNER
jgi:photosystem II stability/assembly factor-like uncharacterized protein